MKPDELRPTDLTAPGYIQWNDDMEKHEHPPHYSMTDSFPRDSQLLSYDWLILLAYVVEINLLPIMLTGTVPAG